LARAVYSNAQILLLDDILSALDVHTSRWIVDQCLGGDLLKRRTVLLVTHNVSLASSVADYLVVLNLDGTVQSQGAVEKLLLANDSLKNSSVSSLDLSQDKEHADPEEASKVRKQKGKQVVPEEVAIGHVGWPICECSLYIWASTAQSNNLVKLYLQSLGGFSFYICFSVVFAILIIQPIVVKAFLAFWSEQYEILPFEEVRSEL
jgi:ABC-type glutathione transport system ATPase component